MSDHELDPGDSERARLLHQVAHLQRQLDEVRVDKAVLAAFGRHHEQTILSLRERLTAAEQRATEAERAVAAMRGALTDARENLARAAESSAAAYDRGDRRTRAEADAEVDRIFTLIDAALSADAGRGWVSPEEHQRVVAERDARGIEIERLRRERGALAGEKNSLRSQLATALRWSAHWKQVAREVPFRRAMLESKVVQRLQAQLAEAQKVTERWRERAEKAEDDERNFGVMQEALDLEVAANKRLEAALAASEEKARGMREALERIADPMTHLKRRAEAEGASLNGMAFTLCNDANWLKEMARAALSSSPATSTACAVCGLDGRHKFSCPEQARGPVLGATKDEDGQLRVASPAPSAAPKCLHCPHPLWCLQERACTCSAACHHRNPAAPSPAPCVGAESEEPKG